jgi:NAD(P)-dependent dehydrogenase (short-subunit alcohol dehydrogenase family)
VIQYASFLSGRRAAVTGAGGGIGFAIAQALAAAGASVALLGRTASKLEEAAQAIPGATTRVVDVTDEASVAEAFGGLGQIDILVNNAGGAVTAPIAKTSLTQFQSMLNLNLIGVFLCSRAVLIHGMAKLPYGRIITVASTSGLKGYAYTGAYSAAKHGAIGLTRTLALELAASAVTVNAICPGFSRTELVERSIANIMEKTGRTEAEALAELVSHNPQKRLIEPQEVAALALWLCRPEAASITGQALVVAGGEIM